MMLVFSKIEMCAISETYPSRGFTAPGNSFPNESLLIVWLICHYNKIHQI